MLRPREGKEGGGGETERERGDVTRMIKEGWGKNDKIDREVSQEGGYKGPSQFMYSPAQ